MKWLILIGIITLQMHAMEPHKVLEEYEKSKHDRDIQLLMWHEQKNLFLSDNPCDRFEDLQIAHAHINTTQLWRTAVIKNNTSFAGFISYGMDEAQDGFIYLLAVKKQYRNQGNAKAMLSVIIDQLKKAGARRIFLGARKNNEIACNLYKKFDFRVVKEEGSRCKCCLAIK